MHRKNILDPLTRNCIIPLSFSSCRRSSSLSLFHQSKALFTTRTEKNITWYILNCSMKQWMSICLRKRELVPGAAAPPPPPLASCSSSTPMVSTTTTAAARQAPANTAGDPLPAAQALHQRDWGLRDISRFFLRRDSHFGDNMFSCYSSPFLLLISSAFFHHPGFVTGEEINIRPLTGFK